MKVNKLLANCLFLTSIISSIFNLSTPIESIYLMCGAIFIYISN